MRIICRNSSIFSAVFPLSRVNKSRSNVEKWREIHSAVLTQCW
jgi:hypothetical protein